MKKVMNIIYKDGAYHIGRDNMWGNYCPETGEYYLARPEGVMASACYIYSCDDEMKLQVQAYSGYSYEVVRELLQLGHLTSKTLATFLEEEGGTFGGISRIARRFEQKPPKREVIADEGGFKYEHLRRKTSPP